MRSENRGTTSPGCWKENGPVASTPSIARENARIAAMARAMVWLLVASLILLALPGTKSSPAGAVREQVCPMHGGVCTCPDRCRTMLNARRGDRETTETRGMCRSCLGQTPTAPTLPDHLLFQEWATLVASNFDPELEVRVLNLEPPPFSPSACLAVPHGPPRFSA